MVQRKGGFRRKTRHKLSKAPRSQGKISIRRMMQNFNLGDVVVLVAEPSYQGGLYHPRHHGKSGVVIGSRGNSYIVRIKDGGKQKDLIVHPAHLRGGQ